jgi:hypothetical protein
MSEGTTSRQLRKVKEYYSRVDSGDFPAELFTDNFQFFFPKFGIGRGAAEFFEMADGMMRHRVRKISHHASDMSFVELGNHVLVEGTTEGTGFDGVTWHGGRTPGGRFCSVFVFEDTGLISRMHIYLDPDYTSADKSGFVWPERSGEW